MYHQWPYPKDPSSDLSYTVDWSNALAVGEIITQSSWTVPSGGVASPANGFEDTETGIQISNGVSGNSYVFINTILTNFNNTTFKRIVLKVKNR